MYTSGVCWKCGLKVGTHGCLDCRSWTNHIEVVQVTTTEFVKIMEILYPEPASFDPILPELPEWLVVDTKIR